MPENKPMIIDCNCLISRNYTAEMLLEEMRKAGVDKALVSWASHEALQEEVARAVSENPGVLYGLYNVDPFDEQVAEKVEKSFKAGFVGLRLSPLDYGFLLDDLALLKPVLDLCRRYRKAVWAWCTADVFCCPILIKAAASAYPDVSFILGFMGFNYEANGAVSLAQQFPNVYLDCACAMFSNLNRAVSQTEGNKVLFGSAAGYGSYMEIERRKISHLQLKPEIEAKVLYENAARIVGI